MAFTYIVECADGTHYVGSTFDLERRVGQYNAGEGAAYTRRRRPVRLVWSHQTESIRDAYLLEKQVQGWSHAKRLALVEGRFEDLPDLARRRSEGVIGLDRLDRRGVRSGSRHSVDVSGRSVRSSRLRCWTTGRTLAGWTDGSSVSRTSTA